MQTAEQIPPLALMRGENFFKNKSLKKQIILKKPETLTAQEHVKATGIYYAPYVKPGHPSDRSPSNERHSAVKAKDTHMPSETCKQWRLAFSP